MTMRKIMTLALLGSGGVLPTAAFAQTTTSAPATTAATDDSGLNQIIVTARRREESLQDVPIAVTAYSPKEIAQKGITDRTSLADNTPSLLTINGGYPREFAFFALRGQGPAFGSTPGVVNYFAEVPNAINVDGRVGTYYDLANVQVLAGPQGTLFGKNATGGNILFEPMKPQNRFEGYARAQVGNYNDRRFEGALNAPVVPGKILLRIAGEIGRRDGYTKDVGPFFKGKDYDNLSYESARVGLTLRPTDAIELYTVGRFYHSDTNGGGTVLAAVNSAAGFDYPGVGFFPLLLFYPGLPSALAEQQARGPRQVSYDLDQFSKTSYWQVLNQATIKLTDGLKLRNIVSYSELKTKYGYDYDATALSVAGQTSRITTIVSPFFTEELVPTIAPTFFTEELQLQGTAFNRALTFSVGGYLDRQGWDGPAGIGEYVFFPYGTPGLAPRASAVASQTTRSKAVFGQATLDLGRVSPSLTGFSVTGGLRYTWEHGFVSQSITGLPTSEGSSDDKYPSYTATVDYDVSKGVHIYVTARDAYKSGGVNGLVTAGSPFRNFPPERLSDIEVGLKSQFTAGSVKGRFNIAAYRGIYDDIQRTTLEVVPTAFGNLPLNVTRSAAKGKIKGVEVNAAIVPVRGLTLSTSYSYIDAKYTKVTDASAGAILAGSPFPYTPKHKYSLGATYEQPIGNAGDLALAVNYAHQSKVSTAQSNASFYRYLPAYGLLNASLDLRNVGGRPIDVGIFANNLTNTARPVGVLDQYATSTGFASVTYNEPRMYGVRIGYRFGQ